MVSLWHSSSRTCVISRGKVSFLECCQTQIFSAVTGLWGSGKVSILASKTFSTVVVASHSLCVFLYLFPSANISPVRFVLHLQDWWCVGKRETSFPVNKLWLVYLPPSLWPLTVKNRYACKFYSSQKNESRKQADSSDACRRAKFDYCYCTVFPQYATRASIFIVTPRSWVLICFATKLKVMRSNSSWNRRNYNTSTEQ